MSKNKYTIFVTVTYKQLQKQICLPTIEYLSDHKCKRTNTVAKCKTFLIYLSLIVITTVYRHMCVQFQKLLTYIRKHV